MGYLSPKSHRSTDRQGSRESAEGEEAERGYAPGRWRECDGKTVSATEGLVRQGTLEPSGWAGTGAGAQEVTGCRGEFRSGEGIRAITSGDRRGDRAQEDAARLHLGQNRIRNTDELEKRPRPLQPSCQASALPVKQPGQGGAASSCTSFSPEFSNFWDSQEPQMASSYLKIKNGMQFTW